MLHPQAEWRWLFMLFSRRTQRKRKKRCAHPACRSTNEQSMAFHARPALLLSCQTAEPLLAHLSTSFLLGYIHYIQYRGKRQEKYSAFTPPADKGGTACACAGEKRDRRASAFHRENKSSSPSRAAPGERSGRRGYIFLPAWFIPRFHGTACPESGKIFLYFFRSLPFLPFSPGCCR